MPMMEWTPERIARFWANEAQTASNYFTYRFGRRMARAILPFAKDCRTLLDYGSGPGFLIRHLAGNGLLLTAADTSPEAVKAANENNRDVILFRGAWPIDELRRLPLTWGAMIATETVEHLDDAGLDQFFDDARRFLVAKGGRLIITTPNEEDIRAPSLQIYCPACNHHFHRWQHIRSWSAETLTDRIRREGFAIVNVVETDFSAPRIPSWRTIAKRALGRVSKPPHLIVVAERQPSAQVLMM